MPSISTEPDKSTILQFGCQCSKAGPWALYYWPPPLLNNSNIKAKALLDVRALCFSLAAACIPSAHGLFSSLECWGNGKTAFLLRDRGHWIADKCVSLCNDSWVTSSYTIKREIGYRTSVSSSLATGTQRNVKICVNHVGTFCLKDKHSPSGESQFRF